MDTEKYTHGWRKKYADLMKFYGTGYGSILGRFSGIINLSLLGSVFLMNKGFELSFIETIIIGIGLLTFILISGFFYIKFGLQKAEAATQFLENPQLDEMYHRVQRMEEKIDRLGGINEQK